MIVALGEFVGMHDAVVQASEVLLVVFEWLGLDES